VIAAFVVVTALTAPGRGGLDGAEARAEVWQQGPGLRQLADAAGIRFGVAVTRACLAVPQCQGVTLWTFTDRYPTTIETVTHLDDIPLVFDEQYRPKPAAFARRGVLASATPRRPPPDPASGS